MMDRRERDSEGFGSGWVGGLVWVRRSGCWFVRECECACGRVCVRLCAHATVEARVGRVSETAWAGVSVRRGGEGCTSGESRNRMACETRGEMRCEMHVQYEARGRCEW